MRFGDPVMLLFLLAIPLVFAFFVFTGIKRRRALSLFASEKLLPTLRPAASEVRLRVKAGLLLAALLFLVLSLARPQFGTTIEEARRTGIDVLIALDTSRSMLAEDLKPNRLEMAKREISGLLDRMSGDRVGIVAFAGESFVLCPLTLDYGAAKMFLDVLDSDTIPTPGTNLPAAIEAARKVFDPTERKYKVLVLLTDGESHEGDAVKAAEAAAEEGLIIHTVGLGTPNGEFVPELDADGNVSGYKKDRSGQLVRSQLDETTLEKIALLTDGKYFRATQGESELDGLYKEISGMEKKDLKSKMVVRFKDRYQWVLLPAILLLLVEMLIAERRRIASRVASRREVQ